MSNDTHFRVGFIGLGIMGAPMAGHVLAAGYPLSVWNRSPARADDLVARGATRAADPAELGATCDAILTIVTDGPDVRDVLLGPRGVAAGLDRRDDRRPLTIVDMSTIAPGAARQIAADLAAPGRRRGSAIDFLDAPVTGGDIGAQNATLTIMVGGDASAFDRVKPLLETMGRRVIRVGGVGDGQMVKACNQICCALNMIGLCEAMALARKCGIDAATMLDVVGSGAGGSWALSNLGPKIAVGDLKPAFMIRLIQKDLRAVMDAALAAELPLPGTELARKLFSAVEAESGGGDLGTQAMIRAYERLGGFRMGGVYHGPTTREDDN
jgi:3-hydroxyisobutyrate dehydrogenase